MSAWSRKILLFALCLLLWGGQAAAAETDKRVINVRGAAERQVTPDAAYITLGVVTRADRIETARAENAARIDRIVKSLKSMDVKEKDLQTANFSAHPVYDHNTGQEGKIVGYTVGNTLTVWTTDLDKIGLIIDTALEAGANQLEGVRFVAVNTADVYEKLLAEAVRNGHRKAVVAAAAADCQVGRLVKADVLETGGPQLRMKVATEYQAATGNFADSQVFTGNIRLTAEVMLVYELQ